MSRFRYNWDGNQDDRYNQVLFAFFLRTFDFVARAGQLSYATATILASTNEYSLIMAQTQKHFEYLSDQRRKWLRNPDAMIRSKDINRAAKLRGAKRDRRQEFRELLELEGYPVPPGILSALASTDLASDTEEHVNDLGTTVHQSLTPKYRSDLANKFLDDLEAYGRTIKSRGILRKGRAGRGPRYTPLIRQISGQTRPDTTIPRGLPLDWYDTTWFGNLTQAERHALKPEVRSCPSGQDLLPFIQSKESVRYYEQQSHQEHSRRSCDMRPGDVGRGQMSHTGLEHGGLETGQVEGQAGPYMEIDDDWSAAPPAHFHFGRSPHAYPPIMQMKQESDSDKL